jgi:lysozyme
MPIGDAGLALIRRFEGFSATPYRCPAGIWTVGYGHVIGRGERFDFPLSTQAAEALLKQDVREAENSVNNLIYNDLTPSQYDALCSFCFNVGAAALQRSSLRRVVNRGDHAEVPRQLLRWVYAGGKVLPGLILRREAEAALYIS